MTEYDNALQRIVARCWEDEAFTERLLADPAAALAAEGLPIPDGVTVNVAVDTEDVRTLVIPPRPTPLRISDEELDAVAAGNDCTTVQEFGCNAGTWG